MVDSLLPAAVGRGAAVAALLDAREITVDGGVGEVYEGVPGLTACSERDSPDLVALAEIALQSNSLRAHVTGPRAVPVDPSADSVRHAIANGLTGVVCEAPMVAMHIAVQLTGRSDGG